MQTFVFDNTGKQRDEVICYTYSLDVLNGSRRELENFYTLLLQYFPHSKHENIVKPHDHSWPDTQQWYAARDHIQKLIEDRKATSRHRHGVAIGLLTLLVLSATLTETMINRPKTTQPPPVITKKVEEPKSGQGKAPSKLRDAEKANPAAVK